MAVRPCLAFPRGPGSLPRYSSRTRFSSTLVPRNRLPMRRLIPVFLAASLVPFALPAADDQPAVVAFNGAQTLYVKLRGNTVESMRLAGGPVVGGLKMANGENPKGYGRRGQAPFTRMKVAALQREQFVKAVEYKAKWEAFRAKKGSAPD